MRGGRGMTRRARRLRQAPTDAEHALWSGLRNAQLGMDFGRQHPIPPFIVDFACLEARLVVEADGGQHGAAGEHANRDAALCARGWRVLRFWNNDILENRSGVLAVIADALHRC